MDTHRAAPKDDSVLNIHSASMFQRQLPGGHAHHSAAVHIAERRHLRHLHRRPHCHPTLGRTIPDAHPTSTDFGTTAASPVRRA